MTNNLTVHCLVQGDSPSSECTFPIKIAKDKTIFDLEKIIKASIDADKLKLWKVNIPLNIQNDKLDALKDNENVDIKRMLDGEVLRLESKICEVFPNKLDNECI